MGLDALGFSRAYGFFFDYAGQAAVVFEEFGNVLNLSKLLTDPALEVVGLPKLFRRESLI